MLISKEKVEKNWLLLGWLGSFVCSNMLKIRIVHTSVFYRNKRDIFRGVLCTEDKASWASVYYV